MANRMASDRELTAIREIADILIPDNFNLFGQSKEMVIEGILKRTREDHEIISLKMRAIYKSLKSCYE